MTLNVSLVYLRRGLGNRTGSPAGVQEAEPPCMFLHW
jgi:hypothetical protein